jgi:hypothetical protein
VKPSVILLVVVAVLPVFAHHSTAAYNTSKIVSVKGTVTAVDWRNPHVRIRLDVPNGEGGTINWDVETWGTGQLSLRGLTKGFLKPGDRVRIDLFQAKDGTPRALVRTLTLPGGETVDGPPVDVTN